MGAEVLRDPVCGPAKMQRHSKREATAVTHDYALATGSDPQSLVLREEMGLVCAATKLASNTRGAWPWTLKGHWNEMQSHVQCVLPRADCRSTVSGAWLWTLQWGPVQMLSGR